MASRLRWTSAALLATQLACAHAQPAVVLVQPSGEAVAANLLRFSIRFDGPVGEPVLPRLALRRADGNRIEQPFLEQELWSPDGRVLTVLLHPGRVKHGLLARAEFGAILSEGEDVTLTLDGRAIKRWHAGPVDEAGPAPAAWQLSPVRAASRQTLEVLLDAPVDGHGADYLAIADAQGRRVAGQARLVDGERRWRFTPQRPWRAGVHALVARGTLEDAAGNRVGSRFETPADAPPGAPDDVAIPFEVAQPRR